jgi:hypothetical protein
MKRILQYIYIYISIYSVQLHVGLFLSFALSYLIIFYCPHVILSYIFQFSSYIFKLCYRISSYVFLILYYIMLSCRIVLRVAFGAIERSPSQCQHSVLNDATGRSDKNLPAQTRRPYWEAFHFENQRLIWTPYGRPTGPPTPISKSNRLLNGFVRPVLKHGPRSLT